MMSTYWDSMVDFNGYLASIPEELERMEAANSVAVEPASSWSEGKK